jgi:hypothetical protein
MRRRKRWREGWGDGVDRQDGGHKMTIFAGMGRPLVVLYVVAMATVIVSIDLLFFRKLLMERLIVNIGIVMVFAAFYLRLLKRP